MQRILSLAAVALLISPLAGCSGGGPSGSTGGGGGGRVAGKTRLNGAGSSFVDPMMQKWAGLYKKEKGTEVNYQSVGSGSGIEKMITKDVDFGGTDAPLNDEQLKKARENGGEVIHVPLVMGGVVPAYNLKGVEQDLKFTGPVLADIFLGKITKWNDNALKELNPGVNLPDQEIAVVHRADGSGTTYIWCDYLSQVSPEWKEKVGVATNVKWPTGVGQKGNPGVAGHISRTAGAIGYIELIYALKNKIQYGSVKNQEGEFVKADLASVTAAGGKAKVPDDLRFSLVNAPGKGSYPISGTTWAVLYVNQPPDKGRALVDFLHWVTHEGQQYNEGLQYARLPTELVERIDKKLDMVKTAK